MAYLKKIDNLLEQIRKALSEGRYVVSDHAWQRSEDRAITLPDMKYVLLHGFHEKVKDQWSVEFVTWKYAIRGKTIDGVSARVVVALVPQKSGDFIIVVTVINLERGI